MTSKQHKDAITDAGFDLLLEKLEVATETDINSECSLVRSQSEYQVKTSTFVCRKPAA